MGDAFRFADELGPARIVHVYEPSLGLRGTLVVDNVATGPSIGGLRMAPDVSTEECFRLARAMTLKNAAAGLPHGGGKSVLYGDPRMPADRKEQLVRAMACALGDCQDYIFGPDMGTDEVCMAWVKAEIGRSVGLPREVGGIPLDEIGATGIGLAHASEIAARACDFELAGARVAIQGFGAVGIHAARLLAEKEARIVAVSDSRGATQRQDGLDVAALVEHKRAGKPLNEFPGGEPLAGEALIDVDCEIWIPAARPDAIREDNVERLRARLVVSGANISVTPGAETQLHERGVLNVPDFIANAGGVICAAVEYHGGSEAHAIATIEEKICSNVEEVLQQAKRRGCPPREAAAEIAVQRVKRAMTFRRWSIF
ncbi:MAG: Glu/Leu/Phe/Val dehydrogenase [Deltaproteobacteria bacterium]|nr:Glu/Leu/Phe/Val dehydrogenase [Deltaproteobacteria bacterium]MBW2361695.1 Glu/Leu/Phe/Val dehydrogenase [Deltaproteobacteria bacterium]